MKRSFAVAVASVLLTGATTFSTAADALQPIAGVTHVAAGSSRTCAVVNGGVQCWGQAPLGDGSISASALPVRVIPERSGATIVAVGTNHACAVVQNGRVLCWGNGGTANGPLGSSLTPVEAIASGATDVSAGIAHTCAVVGGSVMCWGDNGQGQLGVSGSVHEAMPIESGATAVQAGFRHTCAIVNGGAQCWGFHGTLGDGSNVNKAFPVAVANLGSGVVALGGGRLHTCAVLGSGGIDCWGNGLSGSLGNGSSGTNNFLPAHVCAPASCASLLQSATAVARGSHGDHSCAIAGGDVYCWGENGAGELGLGNVSDRTVPYPTLGLPVPPLVPRMVAVGSVHSCAIVGEKLYCWGANASGQLGDGTNIGKTIAAQVMTTLQPTSQSVDFPALADRFLANSPFTVAATASSGLPVTFTSLTPATCATGGADGATVTLSNPGVCTIAANQPGDASYAPADQVTQSFTVIALPAGVPGMPTHVAAAAWNGQATVTFLAPVDAGSSPITDYVVTATPAGATATGTTSPITVAGLTNGTAYTFTVAAVNSVGVGPPSDPSNSVVPSAPHGLTPPPAIQVFASDYGTNSIWRVRPDGSAASQIATALATIRGVAVHDPSRKVYYAENLAGAGRVSRMNFDGSQREVRISFAGGCYDIKIDVTRGKLYCTWVDVIQRANLDGTAVEVVPVPDPALVNGVAIDEIAAKLYWVDRGLGAIARSNLDGSGTEILVYGRSDPNHVAIDTVNGHVYWTERVFDGGVMRANLDGSGVVALVGAQPAPSGLALDVGAGEMIWARETGASVGVASLDGTQQQTLLGGLAAPLSIALSTASLTTVPGTPTNVVATAGAGSATVSFNAPADDGGAAITSYTVTSNPGGITKTAASSPVVLTGLAPGTSYTFTVTATNAVGTGPASVPSNAVTPSAAPPQFTSAPTATFTVKAPGTFSVTAVGSPTPVLTRSGALPAGVTFNAATGVLAGMPGSGTVGTYAITFIARNTVAPDAVQAFTLHVVQANQAITFDPLPDVQFGGPNFTLVAAASSALAVAFTSGSPSVCTVTGKTVKLVAAGICTIAADQPGNANYNPAPQVVRSFNVLLTPTSVTAIEPSLEPSVTGQAYSVKVTVIAEVGVPKGAVTVSDGRGGTCTDTALSSTGIATCSLTSTSAGSLTLAAAYSGSPGHAASTGTQTHVVNRAVTKAVVSSNADPTLPGTLVTINAKVTAVAPGKGTPTGTVEFTSAGTVLATAVLDGNGNASFSIASLPVGVTPIVANYLGDANYAASASAMFNQNIVAFPVLQWSVAALTVDKSAGSVTLTVTHSGSSLGPVSVAYTTVDGTATAPGDYAATTGVLAWLAGDGANKTIQIPIVADGSPEAAEQFTVVLSDPTGATLGARTTVRITIRAN